MVENGFVHPVMSSKSRIIAAQQYFVLSLPQHPDFVSIKAFVPMKVERPDQPCSTLKYDGLIFLVFGTDPLMRRAEPVLLLLQCMHSTIKVVEVLVAQQLIVRKIELATGVVVGIIVSSAREVKPLGMSEFVANKVQVSLST